MEWLATLKLTSDDYFANSIDAVNLEIRLGDVETDCRSLCDG
jgi:hypothetical protein